MTEKNKNYSQIIRSSSLIGGAQSLNMLIGMVRVKFVAILIGPVGVGLVATYQSLLQMIGTVAGLGLHSSAVRDVAQAVSQHDQQHIGRTVLSLRRMCFLSGSIGALTVILFSNTLSLITFDSSEYANGIALSGLVILFANLKGGQMALIQGMRRISDIAKLNIIGATCGAIISVTLYWFLGVDGIVPAIVALSLTELIASWWYARKVNVPKVSMTWGESFKTAGGMIKMGLAFMWNGLLIATVAYVTRTLITQEIDLIAVGTFSAAYALSGIVVNFILGAMGADYYPSLTALNHDHKKMKELVNQQTEVGLLLAMPGLIATIAFAPLIIKLFYTSEFYESIDLLQWFAVGCIGRVVSWPLGYIVLAKGLSKLFVITETMINLFHLLLIVLMLKLFGIEGVAMAFPILYFIYTVMMLGVAKLLIDFSWSKNVWKMIFVFSPIVMFVFCSSIYFSEINSMLIGGIVSGFVGLICIKGLVQRWGDKHRINRIIMKIPFIKCI